MKTANTTGIVRMNLPENLFFLRNNHSTTYEMSGSCSAELSDGGGWGGVHRTFLTFITTSWTLGLIEAALRIEEIIY